jgi:lysophospholipase L1-like esterase
MAEQNRQPWSTKKKVTVWSLVALAVVMTVVLLVGNLVYYWWLYVYIYYKRIGFDIDNRKVEAGHVVFVGDSITDGCDLDLYYPTLSAYNRGIAGQTSDDLLHDMDNCVYELSPSLIVLLIGTNDYQRCSDHSNAHILANYRAILEGIHAHLPDTLVVVQSVYPISDVSFHKHYRYGHANVQALNEGIAALALEFGYTYADVYSLLVVDDQEMNPAYSEDGLHPNDAGYHVISAYLTPIVTTLLASLS